MTEDFSQLENQLRALVPSAPSGGLARRVAEDLSDPVRQPRAWWERLGFHHPMAAFGWGIVVPSAAVAMALTLFHLAMVTPGPSDANNRSSRDVSLNNSQTRHDTLDLRTSEGEETANQVQDGAASTVLYETNDEGVVMTGDQQAAHRVRYRSEDTLRWRNPRTRASIEISYPREEVVLTPIAAK